MDATRARLYFEPDRAADHLQWAVAAALIAICVFVASLVVRELRFASRTIEPTDQATSSTVVPREVMSVPALLLAAGRQIRVGELRIEAVADLGSLPLLKRAEEPGPLGAREVRSYQGLTLVFEPFERSGASRVAAIYLQ